MRLSFGKAELSAGHRHKTRLVSRLIMQGSSLMRTFTSPSTEADSSAFAI